MKIEDLQKKAHDTVRDWALGKLPEDGQPEPSGTWQGDQPEPIDNSMAVDAAALPPVPSSPSAASPVDTSGPLGYRTPPVSLPIRDTELEQAQKNAADRRSTAALGQSVQDYTERPTNLLDYAQRLGGGGVTQAPKSDRWDKYAAEGDRAVGDLMERRKSEASMAAKSKAAEDEAEKKDPNSASAKFVREFIGQQAPSLSTQLEGKSIDDMAVAFPWVSKLIEEHAGEIKASAAAKLKAEDDAKKEETKKATDAESLRRFEITSGNAKEGAAATRALAGANYSLNKEKFANEQTEKAAKKAEDIPPGYEVAPGQSPGAETRKKFTTLVSSAEKMRGLTAQMREAIKGTNGLSRTLDPKTVTKLKQLGTMISIEGKNVAGLGALSGPDMALMEAIASDPTSIRTNLTVDLPRMLDQLDAWGDNSVAGESKATGIVKSDGAATAPVQSKGRLMRDKKTGELVEVGD